MHDLAKLSKCGELPDIIYNERSEMPIRTRAKCPEQCKNNYTTGQSAAKVRAMKAHKVQRLNGNWSAQAGLRYSLPSREIEYLSRFRSSQIVNLIIHGNKRLLISDGKHSIAIVSAKTLASLRSRRLRIQIAGKYKGINYHERLEIIARTYREICKGKKINNIYNPQPSGAVCAEGSTTLRMRPKGQNKVYTLARANRYVICDDLLSKSSRLSYREGAIYFLGSMVCHLEIKILSLSH